MENLCKDSFVAFFFFVFAEGIEKIEGEFLGGKHLIEWCKRLQHFSRTATIAARLHLKSTLAIGYIAWQLFKNEDRYKEWEYLCYIQDLAADQLKRLKRYIAAIPEFSNFEILTDAESILHYRNGEYEFVCRPSGILSFNRGRHPYGIIADDVLKDPSSHLDISQIKKIEQIFFEDIELMPKSELHVFGTPQDQDDLFFALSKMTAYDVRFYPAITNHSEQKVLWPEKYPYDWLINYRDNCVGEKAFNKEMMCRPVRGEDSYISAEDLDGLIKSRLHNYHITEDIKLNEYAFAGFDIGKKSHPSHLCVLGIDRKKRLVEIYSKWMDGWDYTKQIEHIAEVIKKFKIGCVFYDNTRAEFEGFMEQGNLPGEMQPFNFTSKSKFTIATELDKLITAKRILLLDDERQKRQLLSVDNDLNSIATKDGHGDCFWSLCLAVKASIEGSGQIVWELG